MNPETYIHDAMQGFCRQRVEPEWEALNRRDPVRYARLWQALAEMGVTMAMLPEALSGMTLGADDHYAILHTLGRACPALGCALISHDIALALLAEAGGSAVPDACLEDAFSLLGSPLDALPETPFILDRDGDGWRVSGRMRSALPDADWRVFAARHDGGLKLCRVRSGAPGLTETPTTASHGLRLLPVGDAVLDDCPLPDTQVHDWPDSGQAANLADGLLAALLDGLTAEMADRAQAYALERRQGGKMIHEHHAVQQLLGPMALAAWPLAALAKATLAATRRGDASASSYAVGIARQAGLDAVQVLGGIGYMEDYRLERYLRDSHAIETLWVHSAARQRDSARRQCLARVH